MRRFWTVSFALVLLVVPLSFARDLAIIVDKSNSSSAVTTIELEKILKTSLQKWPDGKKVKVFLSDPDSPDSKLVLERLLKMTPEQVRSFADLHKADVQVAGSDELVLMLVANNPGAIGVVNVYSINSKVKVLKVDDKLPLEQGYPLHGN